MDLTTAPASHDFRTCATLSHSAPHHLNATPVCAGVREADDRGRVSSKLFAHEHSPVQKSGANIWRHTNNITIAEHDKNAAQNRNGLSSWLHHRHIFRSLQ